MPAPTRTCCGSLAAGRVQADKLSGWAVSRSLYQMSTFPHWSAPAIVHPPLVQLYLHASPTTPCLPLREFSPPVSHRRVENPHAHSPGTSYGHENAPTATAKRSAHTLSQICRSALAQIAPRRRVCQPDAAATGQRSCLPEVPSWLP